MVMAIVAAECEIQAATFFGFENTNWLKFKGNQCSNVKKKKCMKCYVTIEW